MNKNLFRSLCLSFSLLFSPEADSKKINTVKMEDNKNDESNDDGSNDKDIKFSVGASLNSFAGFFNKSSSDESTSGFNIALIDPRLYFSFFLLDLFSVFIKFGFDINPHVISDDEETFGVNSHSLISIKEFYGTFKIVQNLFFKVGKFNILGNFNDNFKTKITPNLTKSDSKFGLHIPTIKMEDNCSKWVGASVYVGNEFYRVTGSFSSFKDFMVEGLEDVEVADYSYPFSIDASISIPVNSLFKVTAYLGNIFMIGNQDSKSLYLLSSGLKFSYDEMSFIVKCVTNFGWLVSDFSLCYNGKFIAELVYKMLYTREEESNMLHLWSVSIGQSFYMDLLKVYLSCQYIPNSIEEIDSGVIIGVGTSFAIES